MRSLSSWGRLSAPPHTVLSLHDRAVAPPLPAGQQYGIARGMGRSYGDAALNAGGLVWDTTTLDRFIEFNMESGVLHCEAGVLLRDIQRLFIPRGWSLPVTPGTLWITVGGAIANDVHGKNHHRLGSFADHVTRFSLARTDRPTFICGPDQEPQWFAATVGGVGLTGVIMDAEIRLRRIAGPWMNVETCVFATLDEFFDLADTSESGWEHTVAWFDCCAGSIGRGIFSRANPAEIHTSPRPRSQPPHVPFTLPISPFNRYSLALLNATYFHTRKWRSGARVIDHESFLYPLDGIEGWNRLYGPRGFYQYQCVIPRIAGCEGVRALLDQVARSGEGSVLAVLKTFGNRASAGMLGFPRPGVTLALDFPNRGTRTHKLFEKLDAIVLEMRGGLYLAKDARMPRDLFEASYPRLGVFLHYRDPGISSDLSRRLMGN